MIYEGACRPEGEVFKNQTQTEWVRHNCFVVWGEHRSKVLFATRKEGIQLTAWVSRIGKVGTGKGNGKCLIKVILICIPLLR